MKEVAGIQGGEIGLRPAELNALPQQQGAISQLSVSGLKSK